MSGRKELDTTEVTEHEHVHTLMTSTSALRNISQRHPQEIFMRVFGQMVFVAAKNWN